MPKQEEKFHRELQRKNSRYEIDSEFGKVKLSFTAIPNYSNGEGRPDEIEEIQLSFKLFNENIDVSIPILIELEESGYYSAKEDLVGFSERSLSERQISYLKLPFIVIGGDRRKVNISIEKRAVLVKFTPFQIPKEQISW